MFTQLKRESLRKLQVLEDKSPKGCIDEPIVDMITTINAHPDYVTSSSCSGRIVLFCGETARKEGSDLITKGGKWLIAEHATITFHQLVTALRSCDARSSTSNMIIFKHEPFIMHVVCRDLDSAKELLQWGIANGFRESGVVLGNRKIMCAIRTTANSLEIPLGRSAENVLVNDKYLRWIVEIANQKFEVNKQKVDRLYEAFRAKFCQLATKQQTRPGSMVELSSWTEVTNEHSVKILGHSSVRYRDCIVVFGGQGTTDSGTTTRVADVIFLVRSKDGFLQRTDHTIAGVNGPSARMYHSSVVAGTCMVVFGGRSSPVRPLGDVYTMDLETKEWKEIVVEGVGPSPRWKHCSCAIGSVVYVYGGRDAEQVFSDLFALDLSQSIPRWRRIESSSIVPRRFDHVGAVVQSTKLVFWGGMSSLESGDSGNDSSVCLLFDTMKETWEHKNLEDTRNKSQPLARFAATACAINDHQILVVGGMTPPCVANGDMATRKLHVLDVHTLQWTEIGEVTHENASFVGHTTTWMPTNNCLYVVGGGFQCFGFGQFYSSTYQCLLSLKTVPVTGSQSSPVNLLSTSVSAVSNEAPLGVLAEKMDVKKVKTMLEKVHVYDKSRRVHLANATQSTKAASNRKPATQFLIPVTASVRDLLASTKDAELQQLEIVQDDDVYANKSGKSCGLNRNEVIHSTICAFASKQQALAKLEKAIPEKYEFIDDVLLVPRDSFLEQEWTSFADDMWSQVCSSTRPAFSRVARKAFIDASEKRQSHVKLLYVNHKALITPRTKEMPGWVEIRENGIIYGWDLTRVMFSSGNVTEKARMANIGCLNETIVDLFCGIGYYVLPIPVHGGAAFVHACEWNPDSVAALRFNLERNNVADKCKVYFGDNRVFAPTIGAVADRVNLGLLPTSKKAWPLAVQVLKSSGGWFHVHDNVAVEETEAWIQHVLDSMRQLAQQYGKEWTITCEHIEKVKSYAPKVYHLVADIHCVVKNSET